MLRMLVVAAALAGGMLIAGPAFAFHCPKDMAAIDAALASNPKISAEQMAEVKMRRAEGETMHKAGNHQGAVDTLAKAMEILGIK